MFAFPQAHTEYLLQTTKKGERTVAFQEEKKPRVFYSPVFCRSLRKILFYQHCLLAESSKGKKMLLQVVKSMKWIFKDWTNKKGLIFWKKPIWFVSMDQLIRNFVACFQNMLLITGLFCWKGVYTFFSVLCSLAHHWKNVEKLLYISTEFYCTTTHCSICLKQSLLQQ